MQHSVVDRIMKMSSNSISNLEDDSNHENKKGPLTVIRGSVRVTTGFSLTAVRATLRAATGVSISKVFRIILKTVPLWLRVFMQPFLVIYYSPLLILRGLLGTSNNSRKEQRLAHEHFVEGLKEAVKVTEKLNEGGYWPVRINEDGVFEIVPPPDPESVMEPMNIVDLVADSVEFVASIENNDS